MASKLEAIINAIHANLPQPSLVTKSIGRLAHHEQSSGPRISWMPIGGPCEPPPVIGGKVNSTETARDRQIATRVLQVDAYCWEPKNHSVAGMDEALDELEAIERVEGLVHDVIVAASQTTSIANVSLARERWITQDDPTRAGWRVDGQLCILEFSFRIPVIFSAKLYFPTPAPDVCKITFDGGQTFEDGH